MPSIWCTTLQFTINHTAVYIRYHLPLVLDFSQSFNSYVGIHQYTRVSFLWWLKKRQLLIMTNLVWLFYWQLQNACRIDQIKSINSSKIYPWSVLHRPIRVRFINKKSIFLLFPLRYLYVFFVSGLRPPLSVCFMHMQPLT